MAGRSMHDSSGSVPIQYAIVVAGTALIAVLVAQTAAGKVAEKLGAFTSVLTRSQF